MLMVGDFGGHLWVNLSISSAAEGTTKSEVKAEASKADVKKGVSKVDAEVPVDKVVEKKEKVTKTAPVVVEKGMTA